MAREVVLITWESLYCVRFNDLRMFTNSPFNIGAYSTYTPVVFQVIFPSSLSRLNLAIKASSSIIRFFIFDLSFLWCGAGYQEIPAKGLLIPFQVLLIYLTSRI